MLIMLAIVLDSYVNGSDVESGIFTVTATHQQQHKTTLDLTINGEIVHTTEEHPFLVAEGNDLKWLEAGQLTIGHTVLSADGTIGLVQAVEVIPEPQTMYNLTVALAATYIVGSGQWVVHNVDLWTPGQPETYSAGVYRFRDQILKAEFDKDLLYIGSAADIRQRFSQHTVYKGKLQYNSKNKLTKKLYNRDFVEHIVLFPRKSGYDTSEILNAIEIVEQIQIWQHGGVGRLANVWGIYKANTGGHELRRIEDAVANPIGRDRYSEIYEFAKTNPYKFPSQLLEIPDEFCN